MIREQNESPMIILIQLLDSHKSPPQHRTRDWHTPIKKVSFGVKKNIYRLCQVDSGNFSFEATRRLSPEGHKARREFLPSPKKRKRRKKQRLRGRESPRNDVIIFPEKPDHRAGAIIETERQNYIRLRCFLIVRDTSSVRRERARVICFG